MKVLHNLEPNKVFSYFEEISNIPRGSGNEKCISDYLVNFGKENCLEVHRDGALNVIIKKEASKGYENAPTVIIQGHMDMVCEKNNDTVFDFLKDPLKLKIVGDNIFAEGTTLGADNGIAIAYGLAILASNDIKHPAIELLITTDEETGMGGAMQLDPTVLKGDILLNLDSEEEGKFLVSCAGGVRSNVILNLDLEESDGNMQLFNLKIRGLKGGHSGAEIHKERGNANKLIVRVLNDLLGNIDLRLVTLNGGSKNNAIPREADAQILLKNDDVNKALELIEKWNDILKSELISCDADVKLSIDKELVKVDNCFSKESTVKVIRAITLMPNGINTTSQDIEGLVESSTNLGVVRTNGNSVELDSATRSSVNSLKEEIVEKIKTIASIFGAKIDLSGEYPEWQYDKDSKIRKICEDTYKEMYGVEAEIVAIHAGLECGLFKEKLPNVDMISFGPNLYDVHTPNEHMSIKSVKNCWDLLLKILENIK